VTSHIERSDGWFAQAETLHERAAFREAFVTPRTAQVTLPAGAHEARSFVSVNANGTAKASLRDIVLVLSEPEQLRALSWVLQQAASRMEAMRKAEPFVKAPE
jgi:hypothetical protein